MTSEGATGPPADGEQLELVRAGARRKPAARAAEGLAEVDPVALVAVEVGLPHLDRPFEYSVPASLAETAQAGVRVKVRFAGQDVDGFVLERRAQAEHAGRLAPLRKVVSPEPVLTPATLALCRAVADRYAGTLEDVLRLAVPPRHATAEKALAAEPPATDPLPAPDPGPWEAYPAGPSLLRRIAEGQAPAASWLATPTNDPARDWPAAFAVAAAAALSAGRGALLVVPDHRDVDRVDAALKAVLGPGRHVRGDVRAGARPRPGGLVGRRRRPARRAAGALPARARGAAGPRPARGRGGALRRVRAVRGGAAARRGRQPATGRGGSCRPAARGATGAGRRGGHRPRARPRGGRGPPALGRLAGRQGRARAGPGAHPGAPPRIRPLTVLPDLPDAGPLRSLPRAAGPRGRRRAAGVPVVRQGRAGLRLPPLPRPHGPGRGRRGPAHRRGARARVRRGARAHLRRRRRARRRGRPAEPGHRHARRRAGGRGRLRRDPAARRVGAARPPLPRRRPGGRAPLAGRRGVDPRSGRGGPGRALRGAAAHHAPGGRGAGALGPGVVRRA